MGKQTDVLTSIFVPQGKERKRRGWTTRGRGLFFRATITRKGEGIQRIIDAIFPFAVHRDNSIARPCFPFSVAACLNGRFFFHPLISLATPSRDHLVFPPAPCLPTFTFPFFFFCLLYFVPLTTVIFCLCRVCLIVLPGVDKKKNKRKLFSCYFSTFPQAYLVISKCKRTASNDYSQLWMR